MGPLPRSHFYEGRSNFSIFLAFLRHTFRHSGFEETLKTRMPVRDSLPIPWITFPALRFMETKLKKNWKVLEFGAGFSTIYFSNNCNLVASFESSDEWYSKLIKFFESQRDLECDVKLLKLNPQLSGSLLADSFSKILFEKGLQLDDFDLFFIDGEDRNLAIEFVLSGCRNDSTIILDNSDELAYRKGIDLLLTAGWYQIPFYGFGPINPHPWETSFFVKQT